VGLEKEKKGQAGFVKRQGKREEKPAIIMNYKSKGWRKEKVEGNDSMLIRNNSKENNINEKV